MNDSTKNGLSVGAVAAAGVALCVALGTLYGVAFRLAPAAPAAAQQSYPVSQQPVTINMPPQAPPGSPAEPVVGGLIHNIQESFDGGLALNGTSFVDGASNVTSSALYVGGLATGNVGGALRIAMSSSATTTACSATNLSSNSRVVRALSVADTGTAASTGSVRWTAGTSTASGVAPAAASTFVNTSVTRAASVEVITTTSTMANPAVTSTNAAYVQWRPNETINFISGTTTNAGYCYIGYNG